MKQSRCPNFTKVDGSEAQPRHTAQTIAPPINTNTTGRNHLSKNLFIAGPAVSAAMPLEIWREASKRNLAFIILPQISYN